MTCRVPGCFRDARSRVSGKSVGTARGYCTKHYVRLKRHGPCQREDCPNPAISHIGMCDAHTPEGILR